MTKIKDVYLWIEIDDPPIEEPKKAKKDVKKGEKEKPTPVNPNSISTHQNIYQFIALKLQSIILNLFTIDDPYYNDILCKAKLGILIGELMRIQFDLVGQIMERKKDDLNLLNVYCYDKYIKCRIIFKKTECA